MDENIDYSFKVLEEILTLKPYTNREEVISVGEKMLKRATENPSYSENVKGAYREAMNKLESLSFDEMKEIITILESDDDEDED